MARKKINTSLVSVNEVCSSILSIINTDNQFWENGDTKYLDKADFVKIFPPCNVSDELILILKNFYSDCVIRIMPKESNSTIPKLSVDTSYSSIRTLIIQYIQSLNLKEENIIIDKIEKLLDLSGFENVYI